MKFITQIVTWIAIITFWQVWGSTNTLLPSPQHILSTAIDLLKTGALQTHIWASFARVVCGFFLATCLAIPLGYFVGRHRLTSWIFEGPLSFLRSVPPIAWVPIAILWFGIGNGPALFVTTIASFFPIFVNTVAGVRTVPEEFFYISKLAGTSRTVVATNVVLPSASTFIISGLRIGLTSAWMSVVAAEMVSASKGLGYFIEANQELLQPDQVVVGMISIGLIGAIFDRGFIELQTRFFDWS